MANTINREGSSDEPPPPVDRQLEEFVAAHLAHGVKIEPETPYIWADHFNVGVSRIRKAIRAQKPKPT